ncbi:MAG: FAD-dependent oxidoreductase [Oscillospiraceae bacterium]|nr:FAD-dependent oxidoreductase [Oscillospiraceae bacterium]
MKSIWMDTVSLPAFDRQKGDIKTDVLIVGGGMAGLLCGHYLQQAGVDYRLIEANTICSGVTGSTTAKITSQHGLMYDKLLRRFGAEKARLYYEANERALERYRGICRDMDCDFEEKDSYVYACDDFRRLDRELAALEKIGVAADFTAKLPLPVSAVGAIRFPRQAQFHPLKFAAALAKDKQIFENTRAISYEGDGVICTNHGKIHAGKIIVTTHFPLFNKHGLYFMKLYQHRSYVLGLENGPDVDGMYVDESKTGLSFRNYGKYLLLGGGSHRTGKQGGNWEELQAFARKHYPDSKVQYRWATQDCMSLDDVPYIGQYSQKIPDIFVGSGFNKWGMTGAMTAAMILSDQILGRENEYEGVFLPSRSVLRPQLLCNVLESSANLLMPTKPRCPHMGCALKWNKQERSWDCPCHGSRFDGQGRLLQNPANDDLK